jgi:beta-galactosidase
MSMSNKKLPGFFPISHVLFIIVLSNTFINTAKGQKPDFINNIYDYIENTSVFELNQEEGHVPLVVYPTIQEALERDMVTSSSYLSLNGTWRFSYADIPEGISDEFYKENFNDHNWATINVPGNWEMQGFGDPLFRNVSTPFIPEPPKVPHEYNPTGTYRRYFYFPSDWKGKQVFLRFEKVASAFFVWINGKEVGYNEGGQEPAEYNITRYLKAGRNTLAAMVMKYSDGYYLEDQDYWRLAGIFDKVWLFAVPPVHLFDWFAATDLDEEFRDAFLSLSVDVKNYTNNQAENYMIHTTLYNSKLKVIQTITSEKFFVLPGSKQTIKFSDKVLNPEKWSAEFPNLYTLVFELLNASGKTEEIISGRIGFKETEIRNQVFYLNGMRVKLNGINSHMQHPDLGHAMNKETITKDFNLLKQFNINCVRTSHYPPVNEYLDMADEYGIYIVDETGDESHATEYVSELPEWEAMYRERVRKMVLRDRNHPCILFWSAGNESGEGNNICAVVEEGKKFDPSRYWMYGGNAFAHRCEDIIGPRYYMPFEMETLVGMIPESEDPRPSFMDEYLSIAGNGGGGLDDYWEVFYTYPRCMGGAIWDLVSPGLREKVIALHDASLNKIPVHVMGRARLVEGKTGKAIDLNGHDQWVEVYRDDAVEISGNELTLTAWIYPRVLNSSGGTLITKGSYQFGLQQIGKDSMEFYITTTQRNAVRLKLPSDWENNWHHVMADYNGKAIFIFIDGIKSREIAVSGNIRNYPFPVNIGRNAEIHGQETSVYLCDALIDQVGIFSQFIKPEQLSPPSEDLKRQSALWLDFEELTTQGEFFSIGIGARTYGAIWPDRKPQPEMWQIKKSAQPVSVKIINPEEGVVEITNRYLFTNLIDLQLYWSLSADAKIIQQGDLYLALQPGEKTTVKIPFRKPDVLDGSSYQVLISFRQKEDKPWAPAGHEIAWEQFEIPWLESKPVPVNKISYKLTIEELIDTLIIKGEGFDYVFDKETGNLISMHFHGKELISRGPELNVWRAPLANEIDEWGSSSAGVIHWGEGFGHMAATEWYSTGLDRLSLHPVKFSYSSTSDQVVIETTNIMTMARLSDGFKNRFCYTINGTGELIMEHTVIPSGDMPLWIPRVGTEWILNKSLEQLQWYGRGPQENYPDRKSGYRISEYKSTVGEMVESYIIPQDYGLRTDNKWVKLLDNEGTGLQFSGDKLFNFSAWPYSRENLTRALYTYQLQPSGNITFNFDYATSGVGCTARSVFNQYRVFPAPYKFTLYVKPIQE